MPPRGKPHHRRRTRRSQRRQSRDYGFCPFCNGPLDFSGFIGVNGALADGEDVSGRAGTLVKIDLCGLGVPALVNMPGSPLTLEGF